MKLKALILALAVTALVSYSLAPNTMAVPSGPCPISLTNPDGQALTLEKYDLRVAVNGPLSLTEMEMVFRNPEQRQMEGRFLYLLPTGATISRFAKEVNGNLMEGEVVERMRAQAVYTQILHTMRDPALLEMDQGNRFSARVFPIPANGTVRLLLSYSQMVPTKNGERKVIVPLAGLPKIGDFNVSVDIREAGSAPECSSNLVKALNTAGNRLTGSFKSGDFTSQTDLELSIKPSAANALSAIQAGNFQMLSFSAPAQKQVLDHLEKSADWNFYFDTSASNADIEKQRLSAISALMGFIDQHPKECGEGALSASAFDVSIAAIVNGLNRSMKDGAPAYSEPGHIVNALRGRHALGATNLEAVMKKIGEQARATEKPQRFVLVSDGIATLGAREPREILAALGDWPAQHVLHALVIGSKQDEKMLAAICEKTNGRVVTLPFSEEMESQIPKTIADLTEPLGTTYEFYDEGAAWIYPKIFKDVRPNTELVVFSQLKEGAASKPGVVTRAVGQKLVDTNLKVEPASVPDFAPLLQREANAAFLNHLEKLEQTENDAKKRADLRKQRIDVSVNNRVLCPLTSLLVLETERDYQRFGIGRTALADILTIGANGIELKHRSAPEVVLPAKPMDKGREAQTGALKTPAASEQKMKAEWDSKDGKEAATKKAAEPMFDSSKNDDKSVEMPSSNGRRRALADDDVEAGKGGGPGQNQLGLNANHEQLRQMQAQAASSGASSSSSSSGGGNMDGEIAGEPGPTGGHRDAQARGGHYATGDRPTAAAAPAPTTPSAPARETNDVRADPAAPPSQPDVSQTERRERLEPRRPPAAVRVNGPEWTRQLALIPTADQISALHAQVSASPRDRGLRNAYAHALLTAQKWDELQGQAFEWMPFDPENPQVYEYLGKSATGLKDPELALRAMTSIAEIAPNRAALLARAGWLLLTAEKYEMAQQMFREALKNRQDDCNIYRGLALSLWLDSKYEDSAKILAEAIAKGFDRRYGDTQRVLREELGYVLRAWAASGNLEAAEKFANKNDAMHQMKHFDALRVTMCWETDANDVDLHVVDPSGEECWYSHKQNASGLELYSDQTQGLGPEVIRTDRAQDGTYSVAVNYFSAGPMGVSRGVVVMLVPNAEGLVKHPTIVPFCLIPGGPDMRLIGTASYGAAPEPKPILEK